jgi:hypothetical protein
MPPRQSSAFIRPLRTPSKAFVTFLAAAGFAAALLLTPTVQLDLPLVRVAPPNPELSREPIRSLTVGPDLSPQGRC